MMEALLVEQWVWVMVLLRIDQVNLDALGDVVYLEGVDGIGAVDFDRQQIGREGFNSLKISTTVTRFR